MTHQAAEYTFPEMCERDCGRPATVVAKGCMDKNPTAMCNECLDRGLEVISNMVKMYQKHNRRVLICGDCHRPVLTLDTHLEIKPL